MSLSGGRRACAREPGRRTLLSFPAKLHALVLPLCQEHARAVRWAAGLVWILLGQEMAYPKRTR